MSNTYYIFIFFFSSRRRHTRFKCDWSSDVCSSDLDAYYYRGHFFYDLVKTTVIRMAFALSQELRDRGVSALAVTPGFLRSEWMLDHFGVTEANWRDVTKKVPEFIASETPLFVGRGIAALAADP